MANFANTLESLCALVLIPSGLQFLNGIRNGCFYPFKTKELKKNPNIDFRPFDSEFRKYVKISFWSCFDDFWAPIFGLEGVETISDARK